MTQFNKPEKQKQKTPQNSFVILFFPNVQIDVFSFINFGLNNSAQMKKQPNKKKHLVV